MSDPILYLGDTSQDTAAAYLLSLLSHWGWACDYVPSNVPLISELLQTPRSLFVISDYPSTQLDEALQQQIIERVAAGAGLLMVGGWESYHGLGGDWDTTPMADILPVQMQSVDDRQNCDHPVLLRQVQSHLCVDGLPWKDRPPLIGGFNRVMPRDDSLVLLEAVHIDVDGTEGHFQFAENDDPDPLLVVGEHGNGRTASLMTDVAPHWVGPLVDWGPQRVSAQFNDQVAVEVGNLYAEFLKKLIGWISHR